MHLRAPGEIFVAVMAGALLSPGLAFAQSQRCAGDDRPQGEALTSRGFQRFDEATGHSSRVDLIGIQRALADADRGCALGNPGALLLRALALHALARDVDAAIALDEFVAQVSEPARSQAQRNLLDSLARAIAPNVARVAVHSEVDGLRVTLDALEVPLDVSVAHAAGGALLRVSAAGFRDEERTLSLALGSTRSIRVTAAEDAAGDDVIALRRATPGASIETTIVERHPLRPWVIVGAATTGVTLLGAVGFTVWREERAGAYTSLGCGAASASAECVSRYGEFSTADTLRTVTWVATGVFAVTTAVLWWLDRHDERRGLAMRAGCSATASGLGCAW